MIYKYKDKYFKEYFHYGIIDKEKVLEYIIYRALKQSHINLSKEGNLYKIPNEKHLQEWIKLSENKYKQFYRFISLPDDPQNTSYKTDNEKEEISKTVYNKIQAFIATEDVTENKVGYFFSGEKEKEFIKEETGYGSGNQSIGWPCIIYEFLEEGNIVFNNITTYEGPTFFLNGVHGQLLIPINPTDIQKESLKTSVSSLFLAL